MYIHEFISFCRNMKKTESNDPHNIVVQRCLEYTFKFTCNMAHDNQQLVTLASD